MTEQAAFNSRDTAAAVLKEEVRQLRKYLGQMTLNQVPNLRLLGQKQKKVEDAKNDLMMKHYYYGQKANKALDSDELTQWINDKLDEATDIIDEVTIKIEDAEKLERDVVQEKERADAATALAEKTVNDLKIAKLQYKNDEAIVKTMMTQIEEVVTDEERNSEGDAEIVESMRSELEFAMDEQFKSWNCAKSLAENDQELKIIFEAETELKKLVAGCRSKAQSFIAKLKPADTQVVTASDSTSRSEERRDGGSLMKLERTRLPKFGGSSRAYARFKKDFDEIVSPNVPNEVQKLFTLKDTCLHGEAKKLVENLTTFKEIWERLDNKYGYTTDIVNVVINEIEKFQIPKQDVDSGFIQLVDLLEKGLQDLAAVQAREEIANAFTVRLLEGKLPRRVRGKWVDLESKLMVEREEGSTEDESKRNRFEELLAFLKQERRQTERMIQLQEKNPRSNDPKKPPAHGGQSNGAFGGGNNNSRKSSYKNQCLLHPNATHLTRKCNLFLQKTVEERGKVVKDAGACKLCLSLSHVGQPCPFEQTWGTCNVSGCAEHHSRLVHGFAFHIYKYNNINCTLLLIQDIETQHGKVFWDNGSTLALVSRSYAEKQQLNGVPITYELTTVGNLTTTHTTTLYEIILVD